MEKDEIFKLIEFTEMKISELPRPLNEPSRKEYYWYNKIVSALKELGNID